MTEPNVSTVKHSDDPERASVSTRRGSGYIIACLLMLLAGWLFYDVVLVMLNIRSQQAHTRDVVQVGKPWLPASVQLQSDGYKTFAGRGVAGGGTEHLVLFQKMRSSRTLRAVYVLFHAFKKEDVIRRIFGTVGLPRVHVDTSGTITDLIM